MTTMTEVFAFHTAGFLLDHVSDARLGKANAENRVLNVPALTIVMVE